MVEHDDSSPNLDTTSPPQITNGGLIISKTDAIRSFLEAASADCHLSEDLRDLSSSLIVHSSIPYKSLKSIWIESDPETRPELSAILYGCNFVLASPKPREKGEELKARLARLAEVAERKMYEELVKDITPRKSEEEPFSSYKDQIGFDITLDMLNALSHERSNLNHEYTTATIRSSRGKDDHFSARRNCPYIVLYVVSNRPQDTTTSRREFAALQISKSANKYMPKALKYFRKLVQQDEKRRCKNSAALNNGGMDHL